MPYDRAWTLLGLLRVQGSLLLRARTLLDEYQMINIPGIGKAKWQHIENLHKLQIKEGLTLANKWSSAHINYKTQKMKMRLVVLVMSSSVAKALQYLRTNNYCDFSETLPTEVLLTKFDKLFDILNFRSIYIKGYKAPISTSNAASTLAYLRETRQFLLSLEDSRGTKIIHTKRRRCILVDLLPQLIAQLTSLRHC